MKMRLKFTTCDVQLNYYWGDKFGEWGDKPENRPERLFFKIDTCTNVLLTNPCIISNNNFAWSAVLNNKILNLALGGLSCILDAYVKSKNIYVVDEHGDRYHVDRVVTGYFNDFLQGRVALVYTYKGKQWINAINLKTNLTVSELNTFS